MRKIIISAAAAVMALSTTASALEDIKVSGQSKVWYETNNGGTNDMFNKNGGSAEVVFKAAATGKQGNVGFGVEITQGSTMGLENELVTATRTSAANTDMYASKMYITVPVTTNTLVKMGRQELNTPLCFTEKWNAQQNNFDALVAINSSISNLTLIGAYVGQVNTAGNHKATNNFNQLVAFAGGTAAFAAGALYKNDGLAVNAWAYELPSIAKAFWADAAGSIAGVNLKAYVASMMPAASGADNTTAFALSAGTAVSGVKLFAAASSVGEDGMIPVANVGTGFKKTKLPTAGVYTDGKFVAMMGSTAIKVKAAGKVGSTGLALQAISNSNDTAALETTEIDLIATQKVGDINLKGIVMHRDLRLKMLNNTFVLSLL